MKKSFMTRVLAAGLSFAMAFSMAAATNVTTASAASKPKMITSSGASAKSLDVKLGEAVKIKVNAATKKTYKVSAVKASSSKLRVAKNKAGTVVTIRGMKATEEGKPASVKVSFKVKKTGKASKYSYVSKVNVIEDKLTMTAEATHANEIVATFNKVIGSDAKITLTKNASTVANTAKIADDGKSATITLTGKLTDGTYTVTVVAGDNTLTADVVTKAEALSSFEIGTTLKETESAAKNASSEATAIISYKALNQYGDLINYQADEKAVTVSIGKIKEGSVKPCKTSGAGTITVEKIPSMYAIAGQSFTFVIVDTANNTGVTLNKTAVYGPSATPKTFKSAGVYSVGKSAFKDVAENDKISDYRILFTCEDQYGDGMDSKDVAKLASDGAVQVTIAGGLTNIKVADDNSGLSYKDYANNDNYIEVNDVTYFAVPLAGMTTADGDTYAKANAGNYTVTIVNNTQGVVFNDEFTVTSGTVISSIQISAADTVYANQDNTMDYTVVDSEGKTITDYATLNTIKIKPTEERDKFTWKKNADGTAKLVYNPYIVATDSTKPYRTSEVRACTIEANKAVSGKLLVVSKTFTVYHERVALTVSGVVSSANRVSANGDPLEFNRKDLIVLDQYSNPFSADELKAGLHGTDTDIWVSSDAVRAATNIVVTNGAASAVFASSFVTPAAMGTKITITGMDNTYATNKSIKINFFVSSDAVNATKTTTTDHTATFTCGNTKAISGLKVESVNGGCMLYANGLTNKAYLEKGTDKYANASNITGTYNGLRGYVVVTGVVEGKPVTVPTDQWQFIGADSNNSDRLALAGVKSYDLAGEIITETREFSIVVDTADGAQTITSSIQVSNAPSVGTSISANDGDVTESVATGQAYQYVSADALFKVTNQYNKVVTGSELITYTVDSVTVFGDAVTFGGKEYTDGETIPVGVIAESLPGTSKATLEIAGGLSRGANVSDSALKAKVKVTAQASKDSTKTAVKEITINFAY